MHISNRTAIEYQKPILETRSAIISGGSKTFADIHIEADIKDFLLGIFFSCGLEFQHSNYIIYMKGDLFIV